MAERGLKKKILLLGDGAVGKTCLVRRFVNDEFDDKYITTIGAKVTKKEIGFKGREGGDMSFSLMLWDMLGQQGYSNIQKASFTGADGALIVCDLTRGETLKSLEDYWIPKVKEVAGTIPMLILANKADIEQRQINHQQLVAMAAKHRAMFFLTSAKNGQNVDLAFYKMAYMILVSMKIEAELGEEEKPVYTPKIVEKDSYSHIEVADMLMTDFCASDALLGIDGTMDILVPQFQRAGVDVKDPTRESLAKVVANLAEMEIMIKSQAEVDANKAKRNMWIEKMVE